MKKTIEKKRLVLAKEHVRLLSSEKLREAVGGAPPSDHCTNYCSGNPYCTIPRTG